MNRILMFFLVCLCFVGCQSVPNDQLKKEVVNIVFEDTNNLPMNIIIDDNYFIETGKIFCVLSDYTSTYSRLVEFNTRTERIEKVIFDATLANSTIFQFDYDSGSIVFSQVVKESTYFQNIYYYDIKSGNISKINTNKLNISSGIFPTNVKITHNFITWNDQDFQQQKSLLYCYNLNNKETYLIDSAPFLNTRYKISIYCNDSSENMLLYDKSINGDNRLIYFDLEKKEIVKSIKNLDDYVLTYSGSLNSKNNYAAIYAQTKTGDIIYKVDLSTNLLKKIVGIRNNTLLYHDRINTINEEVIYTIQRNITGDIIDHYYGEIYNVNNYKMNSKQCFEMVKTLNFYSLLQFDKIKHIKKINLIIYEN